MASTGRPYMKGQYHVYIAADGAIKVNPGDWLSKYSAAIYNDFKHIDEFGRKNVAGVVEPVKDVNRITAGEILYHIPTYKSFLKGSGTPPPAVSPPVPVPVKEPEWIKKGKEKLVKDFMQNDFGLKGDNLEFIHKVHYAAEGAEGAVVLAEIAGILAEGSTVGASVSGVGGIINFVFIFSQILDALEQGDRTVGLIAVAYATVAWAWDDPVPKPSPVLVSRNRKFYHNPDRVEARLRWAWNESVKKTYENLDLYPAKRGGSILAWKAIFRTVGENDRQKLMSLIMKEGESKVDHSALEGLKHNELKYPE